MSNRTIQNVVGLLLLFLLAVGMRYSVLHANLADYGGELPFTLESALQFRGVQNVYEGHGIAAHEPMIEYPHGIAVFETDTVMAEYVYAFIARLLPSSIPLTDRVRWITLGWFSLSIPLMAIWVAVWTRSRWAGTIAGFFYAVALSSVIRSTGLEISRENFAIPFLLAHLAMDARAARADGKPLYAIASGLLLAIAWAAWDMIQFYLIAWSLCWWVRLMRRDAVSSGSVWRWVAPAVALFVMAWFSPYHRSHGGWLSPALLLVYGAALSWLIARRWPFIPLVARVLLGAAPILLFALLSPAYEANYGHFGELLAAKIIHLNVKPADPALLTFSQRIMWVPALDSATWSLTWMVFPAMLILFFTGWIIVLLSGRYRTTNAANPEYALWLPYTFFFFLSLIAYVLFVRFHVYVALFGAAGLGGLWGRAVARGGWAPYVLAPIFCIGGILETAQVLEQPGRWGRSNVYYRELAGLTNWLKQELEPSPVLANFGVSAPILAYAGHPILLHPKFETPVIRDRVQAYGEALFKSDEEGFRDWADEQGAQYYVYALGEFARAQPELQMRYFVDALEPREDAAARVFEQAPDDVRYFEYLWGNAKYRVFRVIAREDETHADQLTIFAERAFEQGDLAQAETYAWAALALFPAQYRARDVVARVASLRDQGFSYEERAGDDE